ncbi:MAG: hypothetical protein GDA39_01510 [Hyphomonadaceae bacterium]|nr:hypothetical protein [Hyphomonadaceae bacterium]MBC6411672.1 hypothetical protein [Hyphomonadaceae bacterium]
MSTLAGRQKLHNADVTIYDRLVGSDILDFGRADGGLKPSKPPGFIFDIMPGIMPAASAAAEINMSLTA